RPVCLPVVQGRARGPGEERRRSKRARTRLLLFDPADGLGPVPGRRRARAQDLPGAPPARSPRLKRAAALLLLALSAGAALAVTAAARKISALDPSKELDEVAAQAARETIAEFGDKGLTEDGISIALVDMTQPGPNPSFPAGGFRADVAYYPCSVI